MAVVKSRVAARATSNEAAPADDGTGGLLEIMKQPLHSGNENENHSLLGSERGKLSPPKHSSMRGVRFLIGGLVGGTLLVAVMSFLFDDWSHLRRWLTGLAAVAIAAAYVFGKKWLLGRATLLIRQEVEPPSQARESDASSKNESG